MLIMRIMRNAFGETGNKIERKVYPFLQIGTENIYFRHCDLQLVIEVMNRDLR